MSGNRNKRNALIALAVFLGLLGLVFYWRLGTLGPGDYEVKRGNYSLEDGQYDKALEEFSRALEKNPRHPGAHLGMGATYTQMGRLEEAVEEFTKAIELEPDSAVAFADRGIAYDRMGKYQLALADYRKALGLDPRTGKGPGWLWRFLHNVHEKPPTISDRAEYLEEELQKPPEERVLRVPEIDSEQRMYKY